MRTPKLIAAIAALLLTVTAAPLRAEMALVMAEEAGCVWCEKWNAEIGPIYPKTAEGEAAPLRRIELHAPLPVDLTLTRPLHYSPTFVLTNDGVEVARIEGYPGEDFFWGLLAKMIEGAETAEVSG